MIIIFLITYGQLGCVESICFPISQSAEISCVHGNGNWIKTKVGKAITPQQEGQMHVCKVEFLSMIRDNNS